MHAITLLALLIGGDLNEHDKYFIKCSADGRDCWIADNHRQRVIMLVDYNVSENDTRLKLTSKQGFILENIPLDNERWYNECIEIFLECERELPRAYQCMKRNGQTVREISTLHFAFPDRPALDEKGETRFWCENAYTCTKSGEMVRGAMWLSGLYEKKKNLMTVTLRPSNRDYICVHEYIHACGYGHVCDTDKEQEVKNFSCAKRPK